MLGLFQFLGDHFDRGVGIQEAVADDLTDDFVGAAVMGFGAAGLALEGGGAPLGQEAAQLKGARLGTAEFAGGGQRAKAGAFSLVDHGQFEGDFVIVGDLQLAGRAGEEVFFMVDAEHKDALAEVVSYSETSRNRGISLIKHGGYCRTNRHVQATYFQYSAIYYYTFSAKKRSAGQHPRGKGLRITS